MLTLFSTAIIISFLFLSLNHPLSMGLTLLIQTITISMITGNLCLNFWFSYILFLIMIGGMLVLFIYMTSIASNEKFKLNIPMSLIIFIPFISLWTTPNYFININTMNNEIFMLTSSPPLLKMMTKFINHYSNWMMIFLIIYLFLTLIAVVKITSLKHGPLRQKN